MNSNLRKVLLLVKRNINNIETQTLEDFSDCLKKIANYSLLKKINKRQIFYFAKRFKENVIIFEYYPDKLIKEEGKFLKIINSLGINFDPAIDKVIYKKDETLIKGFRVISKDKIYSLNLKDFINEFTNNKIKEIFN